MWWPADETFIEARYSTEDEGGVHLKKIEEARTGLLDQWKANCEKELSGVLEGFKIKDTDAWHDLFKCGSVGGSCQSVDGIADVNKCLMAYVITRSRNCLTFTCFKFMFKGYEKLKY